MEYKNIRFPHATKCAGISIEKALQTKYSYIQHSHRPLCSLEQAKYQKIDYSFTSVRNPYDRALDMYNYFYDLHNNYTVTEFLEELTNGNLKKIWYAPQHIYVQNGDFKVDDIIRVEDMESGWDRIIKDTLGIDIDMLHINPTKNVLVKRLTKKEKEMVYDHYKEDFKLLEYKK